MIHEEMSRSILAMLEYGTVIQLEDMEAFHEKYGADTVLRAFFTLEGHVAYREFFGEAYQIEKRPAVLFLPGWLYDGFDSSQRVVISGRKYRIDEPLVPIETEGIVVYFGALAYRF